jgi:SAC3 family protein LENG8/THP3
LLASAKRKSQVLSLTGSKLISVSYKPDVKIRYITEELGFESDEDSARFLLEHASEELLQERDDGVRLVAGKAGLVFESAKQGAFKLIDLRGQI